MIEDETFSIKLEDLSEKAREDIKQCTANYTVAVIINDIPMGSGTLVKIDEYYGLLTAEHVVRPPGRPELHLDTTSSNGPKLLLPPAPFPGGQAIESSVLRVITTKRTGDTYGPDLAFIVLPPSPLLRELKARRSFYPLGQDVATKLSTALSDSGFVAFCGFPNSLLLTHKPSLGFTEVKEVRGFAFLTGPDKYEKRAPWDFFELGVSRAEMLDIGESFGGVSGGGLWRIPVYRRKNDPEGSEYVKDMTFAGVAFYEENHLPNGRFFVRAHGPQSIYEKFLTDVRTQLCSGKSS